MKKLLKSKVFIALVFFIFGFLTNYVLVTHNGKMITKNNLDEERIPVSPQDFDRDPNLFAQNGQPVDHDDEVDTNVFDMSPNKKEDDKFVYYEIPINKEGKDNKLNVEIKDGYIHLKSDSSNRGKDFNSGTSFSSSMEQVFSIDSSLDDKKAEVLNGKDKIVIKIPKKRG